MRANTRHVAGELRRLGGLGEVRQFEVSMPTAQAAADHLGCDVGAIVKSLVFTAGDMPLLVCASGAHRVDRRRVARQLGVAKIRQADPDFVRSVTGQEVGGVAPIGHPKPITTVVDLWLGKYEVLWAGAGDHDSMLSTTFDELVRMTGGTPMDVGD